VERALLGTAGMTRSNHREEEREPDERMSKVGREDIEERAKSRSEDEEALEEIDDADIVEIADA
jgi:hypothetical protein